MAEWYDNNNQTLPTVTEIVELWSVIEDEPDKMDDRMKKILVWWVDCFLAKVVGTEFWGTEVRHNQLISDKGADILGKRSVNIPVVTEAFAMLMYANCRHKWINIWKLKEEKGKNAQVPRSRKEYSEEELAKYQGKYTDPNAGQNPNGGWNADGLQLFANLITKLTEHRKEDHKKNSLHQKTALQLIREAHSLGSKDAETSEEGTGKKRRKRKSNANCPPKKKFSLVQAGDADDEEY